MHLLHRMNVKYNELIKRKINTCDVILRLISIDIFFSVKQFHIVYLYAYNKSSEVSLSTSWRPMWTSKGTTIDSIEEEGGGGHLNFDFFHFVMGTFRKMTSQNNNITSYVQYADIMTSERSK